MEDKTVTEEVTDDDLSKAFEEFKSGVEEVSEKESVEGTEEKTAEVEVKPEGEKKPETDEEHKENSKLGRKLKRQEAELQALKDEVSQLKGGRGERVAEDPSDAEEIERINDLIKDNPIQGQQEYGKFLDKKRRSYESVFMKRVSQLGKGNEEIHDQIIDLMIEDSAYNQKVYGNPQVDADVNYLKAKAEILDRGIRGKAKDFTGKEKESASQPAGKNKTAAIKTVTLPALDAFTQDYVNYLKSPKGGSYTDEAIAKILA